MNGLRALFLLWCAALACTALGGTNSFCAGVFPDRVKTVGVCMPA